MELITPSLDHHFSSGSSHCLNITVFIKYEKRVLSLRSTSFKFQLKLDFSTKYDASIPVALF